MSDGAAARAPGRGLPLPAGAGLVAWGALFVGAFVRLWALTASSMWSDEGNTWAVVQRSFGQIARDAAADIHPPLYYWLLKLWAGPGGYSPWMLRSFSALCGVALIALVWAIARQLTSIEYRLTSIEVRDSRFESGQADTRTSIRDTRYAIAALAAWVAALNPFQVYYSQEARMYMLLAVEAAALLLILLALLAAERTQRAAWGLRAAYALVAAAGLWTHYSFPIVMAALALGYGVDWVRRGEHNAWALGSFVAANLAALLIFAPWLPIALRQIRSWPQGGEGVGLVEGLRLTLHTLLFGLMRPTPQPLRPWLAAAGLLPILGLAALRRARGVWAVALLLVGPVALMAALGLFTDAFLKFLLVASAPWCVLVAAAAELGAGWPRLTGALRIGIALGAALLAALTLPAYSTNPSARDNYQGIAAALHTMADPARDLVILTAPGQADVWRSYDPGIETLPLPAQRPPAADIVAAELAEATAGRRAVYALFWATDEADPEGLVEGWLDANLYKGMESWQGNVRVALYRAAGELTCRELGLATTSGLRLDALCLPAGEPEVRPGEAAPLALRWSAERAPGRDLSVSVQLLDERAQVVAQQDGAPAGGVPTSAWVAGDEVEDRRALLIPPGTPPGAYRLAAVVYDPATGERFAGPEGDLLDLGTLTVAGSSVGAQTLLTPIQQRSERVLGPLRLVGYDLHKKGFAHAPETPLEPGDLLHVTLYWAAAQTPFVEPQIELALGGQRLTAAPAGRPLPPALWQSAGLLRGEFDLPYDGTARRPTLTVGGETISLAPVP